MPDEARQEQENLPASPELVPNRHPKAEYPDTEWSNAEAFVQPPEPSLVGMSSYLHAFRRRWVSALSLGVTCAALAGAAVWFGLRPTYTATALLRVAAHQEKLVFPTVDHAAQSSFDVYKNTQQQLLRSRFTLTAALRDPAVARLPLVQNELDPVGWLMRELEINFPGEAEIMQVSLTLSDPAQAATLVNAVVQAFMREVVNVERDRRVERLNELDQLCAEKETEVRSKRAALRQLAEQLGAGYTEALSLRQQVILQQFAAIRKELTQAEFELRRTRSEIKVREALLKKTSTPTVSQLEVDVAAENDPITSTLVGRIMSCRAKLTEAKETFQPEYAERFAVPLRRVLSALQKQLDARREELRKRLEQRKLAENDAELQRLQSQEALLAEQVRELTQDLKEVSDQAQQVGGSSIDVEMMRVEIQHIEAALNSIAEERERLRVELRTGSRITLVQPATTPTSPDRTTKPGLAVLAGLAGFFIPVWGVTRWEVGKHRISSCREVSKVLGLNTIGAVPRIPPWAIRRLDAPSRRCQRWRAVMKESVDAVGAMVLRRAQSDQLRVILVSSAVNGEGKTTLATHLARSLASSGYRTLLADFDLRRPALNGVFHMPLAPGVSELLRAEAELAKTIRPTPLDKLSVITAGRWEPQLQAMLANDAPSVLFEKLRAEYDFVVVDGGPILPVADTRLVGQHVDGVILSILRDVSQAGKVLAACEVLEALGVRSLGAIVWSSPEDVYYAESGY